MLVNIKGEERRGRGVRSEAKGKVKKKMVEVS